jgi:hypothetical protein
MSENAPSTNETEAKENDSPYEGLDNATLAALAEARNSIDEESATKTLDLRSKVREILENSGADGAFKRAYNMNNGELNQFVDGAAAEQTGRRVTEVQSIIDAYDSSDSFADRRIAIREALIAAGHEDAFKQIYNMNNLELANFVEAARREHQELTVPTEEQSLETAYDEYEEREGTPYDVDKDRVKDAGLAREMAANEDTIRKLGDFIRDNPEAPETPRLVEGLRDVMRQINDALALKNPDVANSPDDIDASRDSRGSDYVDKDTALNEAYDEYETREGSPYDVDKGREKDVEKAHEDAIAEYATAEHGGEDYDVDKGRLPEADALNEAYDEYETREGEAYDVDKDRVKDVDEAHDQALEENAVRSGTRVEDISEAWDQAHAEDAERTRESKWHRRALRRLNSLWNRAGAEAMMLPERYRGSRGPTKVAIGVVAIAAVGVAVYAAWKFGGDKDSILGSNSGSRPSPDGGSVANGVGGIGSGVGSAASEAAKHAADSARNLLPDYGGGYPWDWAKDAFGEGEAMNKLHELASKAAADGHSVQWHGSGAHEWLSIDGSSNSRDVVNTLRGYGK